MLAVLMDAGPLTALLNPNDEWHTWARDTMRRLPVPLLTSEPVLFTTLRQRTAVNATAAWDQMATVFARPAERRVLLSG